MQGQFDIPQEKLSRVEWDVDLPLDAQEWNVGLIVGPSGSGKSTIAHELWPDDIHDSWRWPKDKPVVDGFPSQMSMKDISRLLTSVGFASPPNWLRPYHVLSTGEQFRASIARTIAEAEAKGRSPIVVDEFTSVVDRTVAQIGSAAIAKTIRRLGQQFIAVTCHEDVTEWLQPDWVYDPSINHFGWRSLQRRPDIDIQVEFAPRELWRVFAPHHYLTSRIPTSGHLIVAWHEGEPIACGYVARFVHSKVKNAWRLARLVTMPDYQGVGVAGVLADVIGASCRAAKSRLFATTAAPGLVHLWTRSPSWRMTTRPGGKLGFETGHNSTLTRKQRDGHRRTAHAVDRATAGFEFIGPAEETCLSSTLQIHTIRPGPLSRAKVDA